MTSEIHEIDGVFYHSKWNGGKARKGSVAGYLNNCGYVVICLNGKNHLRHRLVWEKYNGPIPDGLFIDHMNGVRGDDRIENLQLVKRSENHALGVYRLQKNNSSGANGVCWDSSAEKWKAYLKVDGRHKHVGHYKTVAEAEIALKEYKSKNSITASRRNKI